MSAIQWPGGRQGAVSLSYDDGVPCQFETAAPQLEAAGLRGTFYVPVYTSLIHYTPQWRELAACGHELGNHSLFHPCYDRRVYTWLDPAYDLVNYNAARWLSEMTVANFALAQVDGAGERTFGNTCYNNQIGPPDAPLPLEPLMPPLFSAARGERRDHAPVDLDPLNFYNLGTTDIDYLTFADLKPRLEEVAALGGWIIYTLHGVGKGTHEFYMDTLEHARLVEWLGKNFSRIWTAPIRDVARFLRSR